MTITRKVSNTGDTDFNQIKKKLRQYNLWPEPVQNLSFGICGQIYIGGKSNKLIALLIRSGQWNLCREPYKDPEFDILLLPLFTLGESQI